MTAYVFYDDTDCGGIVYHANYLIFCERARSLLFFEKGMLPHNAKHGFVVKDIESSFIKSLQLGDRYKVHTIPLEIRSASLILQQEIYKIATFNTILDAPEIVFSLKVKLAHINVETKKPCKISGSIHDVVEFFTRK
ncbi:thioesterase family protein [Helicobacter trogontum]|uniref:Acyl-CoA thioesterase n=1 Tax=Helicobacter trogontum TaxID=50960 RepID=A0A4U8TE59_9HELI|nr:thioesterase family protein [Helicobacter trogontum]MDY5186078.1 thioesterase family protein [Helicobacter trogontum]TLD98320.1 acyl-CoA thioesterase [Helicobacter trogontum]